MKVSPFAGKPAQPAMLVSVARFVTAYYTECLTPRCREQRVAFGTTGHRGSAVEKSFNEWHILAISQVICLYRAQQKIDGPLFLGMDIYKIYAESFRGADHLRRIIAEARPLSAGLWRGGAAVPAARPARDYTARVIPHYSGVAVPLESARILWQR